MRDVSSSGDPVRKPVIWLGFILLLLLLPPVWAPAGFILGIPVWVVAALVSNLSVCGFTTYVLLRSWDDPEDNRDAEE